MAYRFPGMDPYLEGPNIWRGFHHRLADEIADRLNPHIGPKYYADIEISTAFDEVNIGKQRTVIPDVAVLTPEPSMVGGGVAVAEPPAATEPIDVDAPIRRAVTTAPIKLRSVRIYTADADELITSIEILSPYNKREPGLADYRLKRSSLLGSNVHLVEIDLLRGGQRVGSELQDSPFHDVDYITLVNRGIEVNPGLYSDIWPGTVDKPLSLLPIPLEAPDPDVKLDLNAALRTIYERGAYVRRIDYTQPVPPPKLRPSVEAWVTAHLAVKQTESQP